MPARAETFRPLFDLRTHASEIISASRDIIRLNPEQVDLILIPRLQLYRQSLQENNFLPPGAELPLEQELGLNLYLDVINFCFQDPDTRHEYQFQSSAGKTVKRATGLFTALAESGIDWSHNATVASDLTPDRWRQIIQLSADNPLYLGEERGSRLVRFAKYLLVNGCTSVTDFLEQTNYSAPTIVQALSYSGLFQDEFLKRAQLASSMINYVLVRRTNQVLSHLDQLTVMADYRLPQVFYNLTPVTLLDPEFITQLINHEPILHGSREERALRASCLVIGRQVAESLEISEAQVDNLLWGLSQQMVKQGEMFIPHMLVATDAY